MRFSQLFTAVLAAAIAAPALAQDVITSGKFEFDFAEVDADGDGFLSIAEFSAVLPPGVSKSLVTQLVRQVDADGDQKITPAEILETTAAGPQKAVIMPDLAVLAPFGTVDLNADGKVTLAELEAYGEEPVGGFHAMYASSADKDRDGGLTAAEWEAARPTVSFTASVTKD